MNFKRFHESKNLFDGSIEQGSLNESSGIGADYNNTKTIPTATVNPYRIRTTNPIYIDRELTLSVDFNSYQMYVLFYDENQQYTGEHSSSWRNSSLTLSGEYIGKYIGLALKNKAGSNVPISPTDDIKLMLNTGSTALPYEPYSSEVWHDIPHYIMGTSTDTLTTLPADIYANDTTATVGLKGDMVQSGTPTPTNPIQPSECGDLETTGEHAGQYKIPILNNSQTTNVYLGEAETTRKIKKLVLDGTENIIYSSAYTRFSISIPDFETMGVRITPFVMSHYIVIDDGRPLSDVPNNAAYSGAASDNHIIFIKTTSYTSSEDFKSYLAQQYAAGTPVTVWYVLAEPTTGIVNEPLRKIGDYADEVSGITIPTIAGANTLSIGTTLQPSEVTATYKGWHPVADVHERENGAWT